MLFLLWCGANLLAVNIGVPDCSPLRHQWRDIKPENKLGLANLLDGPTLTNKREPQMIQIGLPEDSNHVKNRAVLNRALDL